MPKISVIMGVYKERPDHLRIAIDSILQQTYCDFEFLIILDNPDNHELKRIILDYCKNDNRINFIENDKNIGLAESLNRGIALAKGEYIARMDADDYSVPERFEKQIKYLENNSDIDILGTNKILIDSDGNVIGKAGKLPIKWETIRKTLPYGNMMVHPSIMMRKNSVIQMQGYRNIPLVEDTDLWLRCVTSGHKISNLNEYLVKYRINYQGVSLSQSYRQAIYGKYIKQLFHERRRKGIDSFSNTSMQQYVIKNHVNDKQASDKYGNARRLFEEGRFHLKNRRVVIGAKSMIKAYVTHYLIRDMIRRNVLNYFLKRCL